MHLCPFCLSPWTPARQMATQTEHCSAGGFHGSVRDCCRVNATMQANAVATCSSRSQNDWPKLLQINVGHNANVQPRKENINVKCSCNSFVCVVGIYNYICFIQYAVQFYHKIIICISLKANKKYTVVLYSKLVQVFRYAKHQSCGLFESDLQYKGGAVHFQFEVIN